MNRTARDISPSESSERFWNTPAEDLFRQLDSRAGGLNGTEAQDRLSRYGPNAVSYSVRSRLLIKILKRFAEPLVAILLIAAASAGLTGDTGSFVIIVAVISSSITLDVFQEQRAENAAEALKKSVAIHADVWRDGKLQSLPVEQIVPGDVIELRAGDLVPGDGVIVRSQGAHVNEALITGEPYPSEKQAGACAEANPADASNAMFAGTSVVSGTATMLIVTTGKATLFGGIASALAPIERVSAFERGIHRLGLLIMQLTIFLVLFILLAHLSFSRPLLESFLFAIAIAVGLTPELLPMIMTVTLSRGALQMAKKKIIVKRLAAIHDFGAMDVLCTDKTGTLTEAKIALVGHPGADGRDNEKVELLAAVNSHFETGIRSPLDKAIIDHCDPDLLAGWKKLDEVPFDFQRRSVSVLVEKGREKLLIIKGAPESVLPRATRYELDPGKLAPLDEEERKALSRIHDDQAAKGNRLLAVAWKSVPDDCVEIRPEDENDLVIAGFCVFIDPPKMSAAGAIKRLTASGVRTKIVSGDHDLVVKRVAEILDIPSQGILTGSEIDELSDVALIGSVKTIDLFARVSPDQKSRIIRALQSNGFTVGFIGDGVNDAPAIRTAEVGISVEGATDVARAAADLIMLDRDLEVLADGIDEGRTTFANILKYIRMGTSSNFGNMLSMAMASLAIPFLPLLPVQILLNNLLYDFSEVGIPFDRVDREELVRPRTWDTSGTLRFTLVMGALSSCFDILTFVVLLRIFEAAPEVFRTAWFVESMGTQILVVFIIRTTGSAFRSMPAAALVATSLAALLVAIGIAFLPVGSIFGFVPMPPALVACIVAIVAGYLLAAEIVKQVGRNFLYRPVTD